MPNILKNLFTKKHPSSAAGMDEKKNIDRSDPLDPTSRDRGWKESPPNAIQKDIGDFPVFNQHAAVGDAAVTIKGVAMDDGEGAIGPLSLSQNTVPEALQNWYMSQSFIGYQSCAIIAQHWLVDKACTMSGEDAVRNGWVLKAKGSEDALETKENDLFKDYDVKFKIVENLTEFNRFKNIFGIRIAMFVVDSDDEKYYEKPFNIDGITKGSYKGISQIDPYWMMPLMTAESTSDPSSMHFYDPEYWVISGKKYHRSHLIIARGPQPADILKPTYIFGGVPLTQRIYERVYAAERTANEAPLLAMNKRTTAIHVDLDKAILNEQKFTDRLAFWVRFRDNHAVKVLGKDEVMEQFDTSLSDFDSVIMNQYQLVAAIAKTPATKLLGTSPKGFNATGEFETVSYHEELESIQKNCLQPFLDRHYLILARSLGIQTEVNPIWEPVDSMTTAQQADINSKKATTAELYVNMGSVSPDEVRDRLRDDKHSGFNRLSSVDANEEPGMSPENIAAFEKASAEQTGAQGRQMQGTAAITSAQAKEPGADNDAGAEAAERPAGEAPMAPDIPGVPTKPVFREAAITSEPETDVKILNIPLTAEFLSSLGVLLAKIGQTVLPEGKEVPASASENFSRTSSPSTTPTVQPTVKGIGNTIPQMESSKLPKMKVGGLTIAVESPRGAVRKGVDLNGSWAQQMANHYGFIKGHIGADGDEMDCFVGPNLQSPTVWVINQYDVNSKSFDEHKCMIGFDSSGEAKAAYQSAYPDDWKGFDSMVEMSMDQFKTWLKDGDLESPLSAANIVNTGSAPETD